jgi:hypothetical protein
MHLQSPMLVMLVAAALLLRGLFVVCWMSCCHLDELHVTLLWMKQRYLEIYQQQ